MLGLSFTNSKRAKARAVTTPPPLPPLPEVNLDVAPPPPPQVVALRRPAPPIPAPKLDVTEALLEEDEFDAEAEELAEEAVEDTVVDLVGESTGNTVAPPQARVPMQVIVFTSQKGGSGKTTLCGQTAVAAELSGNGPIALVDCDPQGSLAEWWNARELETPVFVNSSVEQLADHLEQLRMEGIKLVFIDTPPSVTDTIRAIVGHADLVVIPTRPSPHDLRAVGATLDIVDGLDKPLVFAVNAATARARITGDTAVALSQHGTVAPVTIHHRTDFATSMIRGGTVMEAKPDGKSAAEVTELWRYMFTRLSKVERRRASRPFTGVDRRDPNRGKAFGNGNPQSGHAFGRRAGD